MTLLPRGLLAASALAGACFLSAAPAAADVLVNGGFESGVIAPWTTSGGVSLTSFGSGTATEGGRFGLIGFDTVFGASSGTVSQAFTTAADGTFAYAFDAGRGESFCTCADVALTFEARLDGVVIASDLPLFDPGGGGAPAGTHLLSHYAGALDLGAGTHALTFSFSRGGTGFGRAPFFLLDAVQASLTPDVAGPGGVPEPGAWALMILGFGAAGTALRRRRTAIV